ncbi:MAG: 50S ribosomal protein L17 [Deltaproteobacteria bacterium]|nr:50S ribosomal protein L17 [Deltaproteobacteria bacterium]
MRHRKAGNPLGRNSSHRRALLRNMVTSLFKYEQIETTDAKAKALRPVAEKMITLAKRGDLHARRQALAYIKEKDVTHRLFDELKDRYTDRQGGYIRIVKKGVRKGDGAPISVVQLLPVEKEKKAVKKKAGRAKVTEAADTKPKKKAPAEKKKKKPVKKAKEISPDKADTTKARKKAKDKTSLQEDAGSGKKEKG